MSSVKLRLAARLRSAREKRGLTQASVAKALGLHRPTISEIEAGRRSVGSEESSEFSRLYGVTVSELLPRQGDDDAADSNGIDFPKIHDVEQLLARAEIADTAVVSVEEQRLLTAYATVTRYTGDYEPVTVTEARRAVTLARRVRAAVRKELPSVVLRTPRK